jgi:hypothetical protein
VGLVRHSDKVVAGSKSLKTKSDDRCAWYEWL